VKLSIGDGQKLGPIEVKNGVSDSGVGGVGRQEGRRASLGIKKGRRESLGVNLQTDWKGRESQKSSLSAGQARVKGKSKFLKEELNCLQGVSQDEGSGLIHQKDKRPYLSRGDKRRSIAG